MYDNDNDPIPAYCIAGGMVACAIGLWALHAAGFRFTMGVST